MGKKGWIGRRNAAMAIARGATEAEARLIHYEMSGLSDVRALRSGPFLLSGKSPEATATRRYRK
jgi:hypothetical protein